jgi:hypothetical protein
MTGRFYCHACGARFDKPSFSEGPKTLDPETGIESVRFAEARHLCPECLSPGIAGPANPDPFTPIPVRRQREDLRHVADAIDVVIEELDE